MTTCLGKSSSVGLPHMPFVNCFQFCVFSYFPFGFKGIVSVPDHCLSFYLGFLEKEKTKLLHAFLGYLLPMHTFSVYHKQS